MHSRCDDFKDVMIADGERHGRRGAVQDRLAGQVGEPAGRTPLQSEQSVVEHADPPIRPGHDVVGVGHR
jgi:hypothetical protein